MSAYVVRRDRWAERLGFPPTLGRWTRGADGIIGMNCPCCAQTFNLANHTIYPDGAVFPSVQCPHHPQCFHENIMLDEYEHDDE